MSNATYSSTLANGIVLHTNPSPAPATTPAGLIARRRAPNVSKQQSPGTTTKQHRSSTNRKAIS